MMYSEFGYYLPNHNLTQSMRTCLAFWVTQALWQGNLNREKFDQMGKQCTKSKACCTTEGWRDAQRRHAKKTPPCLPFCATPVTLDGKPSRLAQHSRWQRGIKIKNGDQFISKVERGFSAAMWSTWGFCWNLRNRG